MSEYSVDTYVRKKSGAFWEGTVVGHYSTEQTPDGVAVQLFGWPNGPVQIYPAAALEPCPEAGNMGSRSPNLGASFEIVAAAYAQDERAALGIEAAFLAGAKFGAMRAANECLAALPKRQGPETGEAMPGNASETAGAPAPPPSTHLRVTNPATISDFVSTLSNHGVKLPLLEDDGDIGTLVDADGKPVLVVDVNRERSDENVAWIRGMIQVAVNTCGGFKAQRRNTTEGSTP